jgi:hypothetical protein
VNLGDQELETEAAALIEAKRHETAAPELEAQLSINEWVDRVRGQAIEAHASARNGRVQDEIAAWAELASVAQARIAFILWTQKTKEAENG